MSYGIHPYAVNLGKLHGLLGSGKRRLAAKLGKQFRDECLEIDEFDEDFLSTESALEHLLMGTALNEEAGGKYGFALKFLCEHLGIFLSNANWSAMRGDWFESVDEALSEAGVPEDLFRSGHHLITRALPILQLPLIEDFPAIGHLTSEEMPTIGDALRTAITQIEDEEIVESLQEVLGWLEICQKKRLALICFYH